MRFSCDAACKHYAFLVESPRTQAERICSSCSRLRVLEGAHAAEYGRGRRLQAQVQASAPARSIMRAFLGISTGMPSSVGYAMLSWSFTHSSLSASKRSGLLSSGQQSCGVCSWLGGCPDVPLLLVPAHTQSQR